jgi:hypothetical protein
MHLLRTLARSSRLLSDSRGANGISWEIKNEAVWIRRLTSAAAHALTPWPDPRPRLSCGSGSARHTQRFGSGQTSPYAPDVTRFVLLHSPLVGPTTWKWVARELRSDGDVVAVPSLHQATPSRGWDAVVSDFADQVSGTSGLVFVAHSGAGPLLASIAERARAIEPAFIFVDAGIPPVENAASLMPAEMLEELRSIAENDVLPPWSEWFGPETMQTLIPDAAMRGLVVAELPRISLSYFSGSVPPVRPWPATENGYILLSDAYVHEAKEARQRGWPVVELLGQHLDIVTRARAVADAIHQAGPQS